MGLQKTMTNEDAGGGEASTGSFAVGPHLFRVLVGESPLLGGARHRLDGAREVELRRSPSAVVERTPSAVAIGIPDARMSGRHARLFEADGAWHVEDLGSTNGTFVDGERVTRTRLRGGAVVEVGSTILVFRDALQYQRGEPDLEAASIAKTAGGLATLLPSNAASVVSLARIAGAGVSILLLGPSGAGKEVTARAIHALSARPGDFVPVNCGALPETLVESQLFGHTKGAFSGAVRDEIGLVRASDRGTLFLDEIGDMPRPSQVALLRVLQEREVVPVGATRAIKVDLRVVAATHRPVDTLEAGGFRSDLYARLAGYTHRLLSLRDRIEDLGILVAHLLPRVAPDRAGSIRLAPAATRALVQHPWPLNVRELEQALSVAVLLAADGFIRLDHLPEAVRSASPPPPPPPKAKAPAPAEERAAPLDAEEAAIKEALLVSLRTHAGNITYVARELGRTRMQIHRWMRRFGVDPDSFR